MPTLSAAQQEEFEQAYARRLVREHGTDAVAVADQIPICEALLHEAEAGAVPHRGQMHQIAPLALNPADEAAQRAALQPPGGLPRWVLGALIMVGALLVGLGIVAAAFPAPLDGAGSAALTPAPGTGTPGTAVPGTPAPPTLVPPTVAAGFVTIAGQQLPDVRPTTLELAGRSFLVAVAPVQNGNWQAVPDPALANWLPGATANWTFALLLDVDPTATTWLAPVGVGTRVTLRVSTDSRPHVFQLTARQVIRRTQTEYFDPHRPGLTLGVRLDSSDTRVLLQGTEEISAPAPARAPAPEGGEAPR